jgi:CBS domain-containing protein
MQGKPGFPDFLDPATYLRTVHPFDRLSAEAFAKAARNLEIAYHPRGARLIVAGGEPSNALWIIRKGIVRLERQGQTAATLEPGDLFGYPSMLAGKASFDVYAEEDLLAYLLPETVFRELLSEPAFTGFFTLALASRLRHSLPRPSEARLAVDFHRPIEHLLHRGAVTIAGSATVAEAARRMRDEGVSSILVEGDQWGIVTDRDLRSRVLAAGRSVEIPIAEVATFPLRTVPAETPVYSAWLTMLEDRVKHLPVTREGRIVGVLTDADLLRNQTHGPLFAFKRVERLPDRSSLKGYSEDLHRMADVLLASGLDAVPIARLVSRVNDALLSRILAWARADLGEAPQRFAWVCFGSEGRYEQTLLTDQDNALIWEADSPEAAAYFGRLAERIIEDLKAAGFPECAGGYMATKWRGPLPEWEERFRGWIEEPDAQALLRSSIFFDLRRVAGDLPLDTITAILQTASAHAPFLARLAATALEFRPPLTLFRTVREEEGRVDVKKGGLMPISGLARAYGLEAGSTATSTLDRLSAAAGAGLLPEADAENLREAYGFLLQLRLRHQLRNLDAGYAPDNRVELESLSAMERSQLKDVFQATHEAQTAAAWHFHTAEL